MKIWMPENGKPVKAWVDGVPVETAAYEQIDQIAKLPFIYKHVAIMADVHAGIGCTVGSVVATRGAIVPAFVGVDIGCGMMATRLNLKASDLPDSLAELRTAIEAVVPVGRAQWKSEPTEYLEAFARGGLADHYDEVVETLGESHSGVLTQLGTLGGGNHFIELCLDTNNDVWLMLHSGSRGPGNKVGTIFIERARKLMEKFYINLPDKDLAYLPDGTQEYVDYVNAVSWAQNYAALNRRLMFSACLSTIKETLGLESLQTTFEVVNCHHNYVQKEHHFGENVIVTRKGAVRAREGDLGIIPGSMGSRSFIVRGKGNKESFESCSHGAGRSMSRTEARKRFTVEDHAKATLGVECRKDAEVVDETPMAYKDIDLVMAAQADLVDILFTLKQVLCIKG